MIGTLVFREEGYGRKNIRHVYEHNERKAAHYLNQNIKPELSEHNHYYVRPTGTYEEMLDEKIAAGEVTTKGLKQDAEVFSEVLIAVNRDFWVDKSEEYRTHFFDTAYAFLKEKYGEENILSCVVHCDEVSEGKVNYHLHAVCLPVIRGRKRYYTKRSKQYKQLAEEVGEENIETNDDRLLKDTENQISHNKFFECHREDHTGKMIYSYAVWQDELINKLHTEDISDVQRGTEGQKAIHLHPNAFKKIMERIEYQGSIEEEKIKIEMNTNKDGSINIPKDCISQLEEYKKQLCKRKASYDLAVEALENEQTKILQRQNIVFNTMRQQLGLSNDYEELSRQHKQLTEENKTLKNRLKQLLDELTKRNFWFRLLYEMLSTIYEMVQKDTALSGQQVFDKIRKYIEGNYKKLQHER